MSRSRAGAGTTGRALPVPCADGAGDRSCIVCRQGCDTGLAFIGEAEWSMIGLALLGIPAARAEKVVVRQLAKTHGITEPGFVPEGEVIVLVSVCRSCVDTSGSGFPLGPISTGQVPAVRPAN
ncbi:hypothetical protein [Streptacidiphilus rugosus]|uniref:hypothetical protein n=1 Tax=Streptacidiphilus rugosus TaxID=405783 RepID=UPI0005678250|nr:hypothetical protein [Streptacidiphilus rugosus]